MCIVKRGKRRAESSRSGGGVVDNLRGGQGNDVLFTGSGATVGTTSIVFGGTGDDKINGGVDADDLRGGRGIDTINGFGGDGDADVLFGGGDSLNGGSGGNDLCDGGGQGGDTVNNCELP